MKTVQSCLRVQRFMVDDVSSVTPANHHFIIAPYMSLPTEVYDNPEKAAQYQILGIYVGAPSRTLYMAGYRVIKLHLK
jgi:hypothetical protein